MDDLTNLKQTAVDESPATMAYLDALRDREVSLLEGKADRNWNAIQRFSHRTTALLSVLMVVLLILGGLSIKLTADIQDSRRKTISEACQSQNMRNMDMNAKLQALVAKQPPAARAKARAAVKAFAEVLDASIPHRNCHEVLHRAGF